MTLHTTFTFDTSALDKLMPMHLLLDGAGRIVHAGPTVSKIQAQVFGAQSLEGVHLSEAFELRRPDAIDPIGALSRQHGGKFYLRLKTPDKTQLIGTACELPVVKGAVQGRLLNLSFGISILDAVAKFGLAGSDFAPTDLTVEMLYLMEAKSAAMEESRKLNLKLHGAKQAAEAEAMTDMLTGLRNRRALNIDLDRLIGRGVPFTLLHLDLDYFKSVNDTLGHAAGDLVLSEVARILLEETRDDDTVARVGGDEFILVFNNLIDEDRLSSIASRMIERLEVPIPYEDQTCKISASIGMVSSTFYAAPDPEKMIHDADIALYASKERGRAQFTVFTPEMAA
ncbi:MAG: diguanylate cyclase domain-containing protein [Maritimibacter sp.]